MNYSFNKIQDVYVLDNTLCNCDIAYTLSINENCQGCSDNYKEVLSGIINDGSVLNLPISKDGEYKLTVESNGFIEHIIFKHYIGLRNYFISEVKYLLCNENCNKYNPCNSCGDCKDYSNKDTCLETQSLFNTLSLYKHLNYPYFDINKNCNYDCGYNTYLQKAYEKYSCTLFEQYNSDREFETYVLKYDINFSLFKKIVGIHYLAFYFEEIYRSSDPLEIEYIKGKFLIEELQKCLLNIGLDFDVLNNLFLESKQGCSNTAPTISDSTVMVYLEDMPKTYTFKYEDFTKNYFDNEGDTADKVRIIQIPTNVTLIYDGVTVTDGFEFNIQEAYKLSFVINENVANNNFDSFIFTVSDNNKSEPLFSSPISMTVAVLQRYGVATIDCTNIFTGLNVDTDDVVNTTVSIAYTVGNGFTYPAGIVYSSTGITGFTLTSQQTVLSPTGGNINFTLQGSSTQVGNASFTINIGGQTCSENLTVASATPIVASIDCTDIASIASVQEGQAISETVVINYTGGNGNTYNALSVASSGVTGLTLNVPSGILNSGNGVLTGTISGTAVGVGNAIFNINFATAFCSESVVVAEDDPIVATLSCISISDISDIRVGQTVSKSVQIPYTGGNGNAYGQTVITSIGITGLSLTISAGTLAVGNGNLTATLSGTASGEGTATFTVNFATASCIANTVIYSQAPTIGNVVLNINHDVDYTFTLADFTTNTTPPYSDPDGDVLQRVKINSLSLVAGSSLLLNGSSVIMNQIIFASDINAGNLVYMSSSNTAVTQSSFNWSGSDELTGNNFIS